MRSKSLPHESGESQRRKPGHQSLPIRVRNQANSLLSTCQDEAKPAREKPDLSTRSTTDQNEARQPALFYTTSQEEAKNTWQTRQAKQRQPSIPRVKKKPDWKSLQPQSGGSQASSLPQSGSLRVRRKPCYQSSLRVRRKPG